MRALSVKTPPERGHGGRRGSTVSTVGDQQAAVRAGHEVTTSDDETQ